MDIDAAIERGMYIASDVAEPADPGHTARTLAGLNEAALKAGNEHPRIAACGERAGRFWEEGKTDAALRLEQLFKVLASGQDMNILCVYPLPPEEHSEFKRLCEEHSAVSYR